MKTKICNICGKEYEYNSIQSKYCSKSCMSFAYKQRKIDRDLNSDYVICEICLFKFKEINNDHLKKNKISCKEYDKIYGYNKRTSEKTKHKKNTLTNMMTPDFSKKLSYSHKIDNYIHKYGKINGTIKYQNMIDNKKYKNGSKSYIDKYGKEIGLTKFKEVQLKKGMTLENQIKLHGLEIGTRNYLKWLKKIKIKNTFSYYIEIYGYYIGLEKWMNKNNKISLSNSKISPDERKHFKNYILDVEKYTRISLTINPISMKELRGKKYGYDLDHVVSKIDGFNNNVPPYIIGHISNLKIVNSSYNRKKMGRSDLEISYIINKYEKDNEYKNIVEIKLQHDDYRI